MVNKFVRKIIVQTPAKSSAHKGQKTQIVFRIISAFVPPGAFMPGKKEIPQDYLQSCGKYFLINLCP